ncbi:hypothetical protein [Haloprofundus sp. MHR1]|uniref:hypothetical protein n=1 Tax=Haloprofundus sp. MHR1 TaxID=2572921 RepID=UPI0010BEC453|nr:hypothetical protein [Haloprofundus sp. MHR1]QCJ46816.1 hypothetical protein FCF25_06700 [Haloprofundus sp. MHR1]
MSTSPSEDLEWAERWDQLFDAISAEPRREIIKSLLDVPQERRLRLPEAAESPNQSIDSETFVIELRHHHLPKLAEGGYVRWERETFCVQRGPNFAEPAFIIENVLESTDEIPESLVTNCRVIQEMVDNDPA